MLKKLLIPKHTCYCYTLKKGKRNKKSWINGYKIKPCPYFKVLKEKDRNGHEICYCRLLKLRSEYQECNNLLWDMVKECGINDDWEEE